MKAPAGIHGGEVRVYEAADGEVRVDVRLDRETVWSTQEQMSQLFGRERSVITKHVRNVFRDRELEPGATCAKFAQVQTAGDRTDTRNVDHYNLTHTVLKQAEALSHEWAVAWHLAPAPRAVVAWRAGDAGCSVLACVGAWTGDDDE
jgi:hypothetical protein